MTMFDNFAEFWGLYPRKVAKGAARKAYGKALRIASHDEIMAGLRCQIPGMAKTEARFIPHPSTWLNQERWADEIEGAKNKSPETMGEEFEALKRGAQSPIPSVREHCQMLLRRMAEQ